MKTKLFFISLCDLDKIGQDHPSLNLTLHFITWITGISMELIQAVGVEIL